MTKPRVIVSERISEGLALLKRTEVNYRDGMGRQELWILLVSMMP